MSISFEGIFPGDRVRIEFAEPLAGWVEGVVHSARRNDVKLATVGAGEMDYLHLVREEVALVEVIQAPVKPGDLVWTQGTKSGTAWVIKFTSDDIGPFVAHPLRPDVASISVDDLPDDAVWLIRDGKLNPKLGGEG